MILLNDINDFPIKDSLLLSFSGLIVGLDGILVLSFTSEAEIAADLLSASAHQDVIVDVSQSVILDRVDCLSVSVASGLSKIEVVGSLRHALEATAEDGVSITDGNGGSAEHPSLHARSAHFVHSSARSVELESSTEGDLSCWSLTTAS